MAVFEFEWAAKESKEQPALMRVKAEVMAESKDEAIAILKRELFFTGVRSYQLVGSFERVVTYYAEP